MFIRSPGGRRGSLLPLLPLFHHRAEYADLSWFSTGDCFTHTVNLLCSSGVITSSWKIGVPKKQNSGFNCTNRALIKVPVTLLKPSKCLGAGSSSGRVFAGCCHCWCAEFRSAGMPHRTYQRILTFHLCARFGHLCSSFFRQVGATESWRLKCSNQVKSPSS